MAYIDKFDKNAIFNADTIETFYKQVGCFNYYFEKSILIKNKMDDSYFISTHFNNGKSLQQKKATSNIIDDLFSLQNELLKSDNFVTSTSTERFYIAINNKVYRNIKNHEGTHIYADFKKKYITIE